MLLISPTNQLRQDLNVLAQAQLRDTGRLSGEPLGFQTSEGDTIHAGEKLILKRNDRALGVDNGTRATALAAFDEGLLIQVGDREVLLPAGYISEHVRLGYAVTIHDSQGATADHAIVVTPVKNLDSELAYVAASRARHTTTVLVLTDPDPGWKNLKSRLRLEGAEQTATQHLEAAARVVLTDPHPDVCVEGIRRPRSAATNRSRQSSPLRRPRQRHPRSSKPVHRSRRGAADTARGDACAQRWPVSKHRYALAELDLKLERREGNPCPGHAGRRREG